VDALARLIEILTPPADSNRAETPEICPKNRN
jgi:hypothetical protein